MKLTGKGQTFQVVLSYIYINENTSLNFKENYNVFILNRYVNKNHLWQ